jgi:hypothetical protein
LCLDSLHHFYQLLDEVSSGKVKEIFDEKQHGFSTFSSKNASAAGGGGGLGSENSGGITCQKTLKQCCGSGSQSGSVCF